MAHFGLDWQIKNEDDESMESLWWVYKIMLKYKFALRD